jgi:hypothetical protein
MGRRSARQVCADEQSIAESQRTGANQHLLRKSAGAISSDRTFVVAMETSVQRRRNLAPLAGCALVVLALFSNGLFFLDIPGKRAIPWISLILSIVGIALAILGAARAFGRSQIYRGRISSAILGVVSLVAFSIGLAAFHHARDLPASSKAPRVGDVAPEFSLVDTSGTAVQLSQLLSAPINGSSRPKAVLLIFYRGFW